MEGPANTLNYMLAGYAVFFGTLLIYLVSLVVRWNNLKKDWQILQEDSQEKE
mgnify:FL=1